MHRMAVGKTREEIVQQVINKEAAVDDRASYIPIGGAAEKLREWHNQGAIIFYLTSCKKLENIAAINAVLQKYGFPKGALEYRHSGEEYKDVIERIMPDVYIEDDCESLGGADEMASTNLSPDAKARIKTIIIKEFAGITYLSDNLTTLK